MISQEKINFRVTRDFSETFNVSIKFLRQNFKSYFVCLLLLAGPFILFYSISSAYYEVTIMNKQALVRAGRLYNMNTYGWEYFLSLFFQLLSYLSMMCITYGYMVLYQEKGRDNFTPGDVVKKMNEVIGKITGAFFLFFFLIIIFIVAIVMVVGLIGSGSNIAGILLVLSLVIGLLLIAPNLSWQLSTTFLVIIAEEEIPLSAYGRTRDVMKRNFWWTWLLMVCSSLMVFFLALVFALPQIIYTLILSYGGGLESQETSVIYTAVTIVCFFSSMLVYSMTYIICGFHFFSLAEKRDGAGLMEQINEIGKTNTKEQQQF